MKILICDDELLAAEKIADLVSHFAAQRHLAVSVVKFTDVEKCMKSSLERCDIAFLDIDMKPYNGIDLARVLHDANPNAIIIFVTNCIEYAPAWYKVNAFRYLLKPLIAFLKMHWMSTRNTIKLYHFLLILSILRCRYKIFCISNQSSAL